MNQVILVRLTVIYLKLKDKEAMRKKYENIVIIDTIPN